MSKTKRKLNSDTFDGIPMDELVNPVDQMYLREQPVFGIPMDELNNKK